MSEPISINATRALIPVSRELADEARELAPLVAATVRHWGGLPRDPGRDADWPWLREK